MKRHSILSKCLIIYGLMMAGAFFLIFIPNRAMIRISSYCGLPAFEVTPIFEYLARGMAALCFMFGVLLIYIGLHLAQHLKLVRFLGWFALLTLPLVVFIHAKVSTPFWWKVGDIAGVLLLCLLCLAAPKSLQNSQSPGDGESLSGNDANCDI
ncbi:MAG: hypothetical protein AMJ79_09100 [Phycisphaerae bacterium SM23_30]|nr:MAG: hypothetical protein AMJ79_09100 [Phycisphaerae bacterium SM23_30]